MRCYGLFASPLSLDAVGYSSWIHDLSAFSAECQHYKNKQQDQLHKDFCATPLTQSWPIQTKWNPDCIKGNNKISPAFTEFYFSSFFFIIIIIAANFTEWNSQEKAGPAVFLLWSQLSFAPAHAVVVNRKCKHMGNSTLSVCFTLLFSVHTLLAFFQARTY